jgi:esterase/lipase
MEPLGEYLRSLGFNTYRVVLTGHSTPHDTSFPASSWVDDIRNAYTSLELANRALPIHIAAFSLGGLVTTRALDIFPELKPKSILFIAPALSLRALVQSAYLLHVLPPLTLGVPNIAPPYYRRFPHTPLFWYRNTIELYAQTRSLASHERLQSIPTLIIANPRDELVSLSGLTEWIKDNRLAPAWRLEVVRPARREPFMPEHLLVDRGSFGESEWQRFTVRTGEFLR